MDNKYAGRILSISLAALIFSSYITVANIMDLQRSCAKTTEQVTILEQEVYDLKDEVATILENCQPVEEEEPIQDVNQEVNVDAENDDIDDEYDFSDVDDEDEEEDDS